MSWVFAGKQGWGPSEVALVSIQDSGDLAADGAGVGACGRIGGYSDGLAFHTSP